MTFPSIVSTVSGAVNQASALVVTLPTCLPGDVLLFLGGGRALAPSTPSGWTTAPTDGGEGHPRVCWKVAAGTEGGTTADFGGWDGVNNAIVAYRLLLIRGGSASVEVTQPHNQDTYTCPTLTPTYGAADTLWIVLGLDSHGALNSDGYITWPTTFTLDRARTATGGFDDIGIATCAKQETTASQVPGTLESSWQSGIDALLTVAVGGAFAAGFSAAPRSGDFPLVVEFTDESSGGSGTPVSWAWDFGDGSTSTAQDPDHTYLTGGVFDVSLAVTTDDAETDTETKSEYIAATTAYVAPEPAAAVIEIRAAAPGSSRWGIARWGVGTWSAAGWQDVTPQSVDAVVRWGSHEPSRGILAEVEAGSWIVDTYDPERLLDPGNADSPYAADLRAGLPIRIRHRETIVRQGVAETIAYFHDGNVGGIRVTDSLSLLARSPVPADSVLADTLRARAADAISAAGLSVQVEPVPPVGDPVLAPRLEGDHSVWRHIADAAEQVLHVAWIDRLGTVRFREWAGPYDRGRGVDEARLVNLGTIASTAGLYSVVRAQQTVGDGGLLIERRSTPVPRYGAVTYERSDPTPNAEAWAEAVLADRALQTVQWIPGAILPLDADDVEYFATLEAMERFAIENAAADPAVEVSGLIIGGQIRVRARRGSSATWGFELELAQTAPTPLYVDGADPPEWLLGEGGDHYLYAD